MIEVRVNELRDNLGFSVVLFIGHLKGDSSEWKKLIPKPNLFPSYEKALETGKAWGEQYVNQNFG